MFKEFKNDKEKVKTIDKLYPLSYDDYYTLSITTKNIIKEISSIQKLINLNKESIYSILVTNLFEENFNESIKNKKYIKNTSTLNFYNNEKKIQFIFKEDNINVPNIKEFINNDFNNIFYFKELLSISKKQHSKNCIKRKEILSTRDILKKGIFKLKNFNFNSILQLKINDNNKDLSSSIQNKVFIKNLIKTFKVETDIDLEKGIIKKDGIEINLENTSNGIMIIESLKNLIEKSFFQDGNFIIIDEPETYLHPEWQYLFTKLLLEISSKLNNFKLIISTHSPYIIETIYSFSQREFQNLNFKYNFTFKDKNSDSYIKNETDPIEINKALSFPYRKLDEDEYKWKNKK